ncbi:MAG: efflux RND transporter periplasmic adaptor subunit [Vicinamibacterales bacterium]
MTRSTSSRPLAAALAVALAGAILTSAGCSRGAATTANASPADAPKPGIAVTTAVAVMKPMPVTVDAVGRVEAVSSVDVRAQVAGEIVAVGFDEGQDVAAGQLLFTIDPRPFEVALRQAEAALARDEAQVRNAQAQRDRLDTLYASGLVAKSELDTASTSVAALTATVEADRAQVDTAKLQLERTKVFAPVAGRTGALLAHAGSIVRANDTAPLVVINQVSPAYVSFAIPARLIGRLGTTPGRRVEDVEARLPDGRTAGGTVSFVDNAVDASTDTIRVKATFANADRRLWPGAYVDVRLRLAVEPRAIVVPSAAVLPGQQGQYLYVVGGDGTVEARTVTVAWTDGADSVIQQGVAAGDTVVTDGQLRLTPGARVAPRAVGTPGSRP